MECNLVIFMFPMNINILKSPSVLEKIVGHKPSFSDQILENVNSWTCSHSKFKNWYFKIQIWI